MVRWFIDVCSLSFFLILTGSISVVENIHGTDSLSVPYDGCCNLGFSGELFRLKVYKMIQLRFLAMFAGLFIRGSVGCQRRY